MATTQAQFNAQLQSFFNDVLTQSKLINAAVQSIIDKNAAAGAPLDLSAEANQLSQAQAALDAIAPNLPGGPSAPAAVTPVGATTTTPVTDANREPGPSQLAGTPDLSATPANPPIPSPSDPSANPAPTPVPPPTEV